MGKMVLGGRMISPKISITGMEVDITSTAVIITNQLYGNFNPMRNAGTIASFNQYTATFNPGTEVTFDKTSKVYGINSMTFTMADKENSLDIKEGATFTLVIKEDASLEFKEKAAIVEKLDKALTAGSRPDGEGMLSLEALTSTELAMVGESPEAAAEASSSDCSIIKMMQLTFRADCEITYLRLSEEGVAITGLGGIEKFPFEPYIEYPPRAEDFLPEIMGAIVQSGD